MRIAAALEKNTQGQPAAFHQALSAFCDSEHLIQLQLQEKATINYESQHTMIPQKAGFTLQEQRFPNHHFYECARSQRAKSSESTTLLLGR